MQGRSNACQGGWHRMLSPPLAALRGRTVRCAKRRLFSTTGSHESQGPEFCTLQPLLELQGFFFSLMLATGPRVLNSAPHAVLN